MTMSIEQTLAEQLGIETSEITPEKRFVQDLNCDSLDLVELQMALEDEFSIEMPDEQWDAVTTVQEAIDLVNMLKRG